MEVRSTPWVVGFLGRWDAYTVFVLPAIFELGPVLAITQFGGASGLATITVAFDIGSLIVDFILLKWRPRFAQRVAAFALVGASWQAGIIGCGLGVWPIAGLALIIGMIPLGNAVAAFTGALLGVQRTLLLCQG